MRVPLTTRDFLDRAELVYGDRVGIVDEPNQPAPSLGEVSYRDVARRGRALQAGLDSLGIGEGERVAIVSHNAARLLELLLSVPSAGRVAVPINFRLSPEEVSYIVGHSGARVLLVDPELESSLKGVEAEHRFGTGEEYEQLLGFDTEPRAWAEPDEDATATINYTSGTTARPKGVQMTHRNLWVNAVTFGMHMQVSDRDVYLHTLPMFHCNGWGLPYTMAGLGARAGRAAQGRRAGDPAPGRAARRHADGRGARGVERRPRGRRRVGRRDPRPRPGADHRRRRAAAVEDDRAGRGGAGLGVQPDLRPHRDRAAADHQPSARRVRRPRAGGAGQAAVAGRRPVARHAAGGQRVRRGARAEQHGAGRLLGEPGRLRGGPRRAAGSTPGTAARSTTAAT